MPAVRALSSTAMRPDNATYSSPFKGYTKASNIPDFGKYMSGNNENSNKTIQYFMVGTMGAITAAGAKSTVQGGSSNVFRAIELRLAGLLASMLHLGISG
jgi:ubiquinol-cytochrome c reductase iron-sulfur subunit